MRQAFYLATSTALKIVIFVIKSKTIPKFLWLLLIGFFEVGSHPSSPGCPIMQAGLKFVFLGSPSLDFYVYVFVFDGCYW